MGWDGKRKRKEKDWEDDFVGSWSSESGGGFGEGGRERMNEEMASSGGTEWGYLLCMYGWIIGG